MAYELFMDGFDHYPTADINKKWTLGSTSGVSISVGGGRRGGNAIYQAVAPGLGRNIPQSSHGVIGCAVYCPVAGREVLAVYDGGTIQLRLRLNSQNRFEVYRNATLLVTSTNNISLNTWNYIELGFQIADAGSIELRVNGFSTGWVPQGTYDTKESANAYFNSVWLGYSGSNTNLAHDDLYVAYGDEIKFLGDSRVDTLTLTANSTPQDWTPDTGNAWERLNQDAGYVSSSTVNATSMFVAGDIAHNPAVIHGVQVNGHLYKTDAGNRQAALLMKSGATTVTGPSNGLSTSTQVLSQSYTADPDTGSAFTKSKVNALEVGVKVTA